MLKATLKIADLEHVDPAVKGCSIEFGESYIRPFQHKSLESSLVKNTEQWFFVIRERQVATDGADVHPVLIAHASTDQFRQHYQKCMHWPLDFIVIEAARRGPRLRVRAGHIGSLPIYFHVEERTRTVTLSWDFVDFLDKSRAIDAEIIAHHLSMRTFYSARQACVGVNLLTAGSTLYVDRSETSFEYGATTSSAPELSGREESNHVLEFSDTLQAVVRSRPTAFCASAVELSGGMDSAAVAIAVGESVASLACGGILLGDGSSPKQIDRRASILSALNCRDHKVEMHAHMPAIDIDLDLKGRLPLISEYYLEAFGSLWDRFRGDGCEIIWTGIGGDELCARFSSDEGEPRSPSSPHLDIALGLAEDLLTKRGLDVARSSFLFSAPISATLSTTLLASLCHARPLATRGLWPVRPFGDPRLINFGAKLPFALRSGKELLRSYLSERLGSDVFPHGYPKETFALVLPKAIAARADIISSQLASCALADFGLVSQEAVMALLKRVITTHEFLATSTLARFLWAERFVRQLC
jgi:asparagine synthase (glutamine-hydrolysing)